MQNYVLNDKWTLRLHYKDLGNCYNENLEKLMDINDIFTFWQTFNNIPKLHEIFSDGVNCKKMKRNMATPCAYSFFKNDIDPCWENEKNSNGYEISIRSCKDFSNFHDLWLNILISLIGNQCECYRFVNGVRAVDCTKRSSVMYRIEIWLEDENMRNSIDKEVINSLNISNYKTLFRSHKNVKENII